MASLTRAHLENCNHFTVPRLNLDRFTADFPKIKITSKIEGGARSLLINSADRYNI
jgi:hypothetical protein